MRNLLVATAFAVISVACTSQTGTGPINRIAVEPSGEFAEVDVERQNAMMKRLLSGDREAVDEVLASPELFSPPVLYALSDALVNAGRMDEAMYWFYSGQLKARSDAEKALDVSARQAVSVLNMRFGSPINQYAFQDVSVLKDTVERVVSSDRDSARLYDARWIALHGLDAFDSDTVAFEPEQRWDEINESTRVQYLEEFYEVVQQFE